MTAIANLHPMSRRVRPEKDAPRSDGAREEQKALQAFVCDFLNQTGCETHFRNGELFAILSPEAEALFGTPALRLAFRASDLSDPEVHLVQPGSVLLEKMVAYLRARVGVALAALPAVVPPDSALPPEIDFRCEAHVGRVEVEPEELVTFNFRISYTCDEKNEEIYSVTVDSEGRSVTDEGLIARVATAAPCEEAIDTSRRALGFLYSAAEQRVRVHAEETAARYEQETLPRLYREIARLRAFYQSQIAELDPDSEEDDHLRDLYERELRLRTDEEIQNHRMTVAVSLANFRVVRLPRARVSLRLRNEHARRTLVLERELDTGALVEVACESCGAPLREVDLCAGAHVACPACLRLCEQCGSPRCTACGMEPCAQCSREVCGECQVTCAACENRVCLDHSATCPVCERAVCQACLQQCAVCHESQCALHLERCGACGHPACSCCRETCAACGGAFCLEHTATCPQCGQVFCPTHRGTCSVCGAERCMHDLATCAGCGQTLCEAHRVWCAGCGSSVCAAHAQTCDVCGVEICAVCGSTCALTEWHVCPEHARVCAVCARTVAESQTANCHLCGEVVCLEHAQECSECGQPVCLLHSSACRFCGRPVCTNCAVGQGLCSACADPEAGEEVPASEVASLQGLHREWLRRLGAAPWRKVRRRGCVLYHGSGPFLSVVIVATPGGRVIQTGGSYERPRSPWRFW